MMTRIRLGMLTPSSNTVLEPVTTRMLLGLPEVSAHFGRFRVVRIALSDEALEQFDPAPILEAARLLADARVDVIAWNGTSAGWMGFESDVALCRAITEATGVPATSSVLALNEALGLLGARSLGLVTPYTDDVQGRIVANYQAAGFAVVAERHLGDPGNFSFSEYGEEEIEGMVRAVAAVGPDAITTFCTNLRSTGVAASMEAETGIPILDTITTAVWGALRLARVDPRRVEGWGRLFQLPT